MAARAPTASLSVGAKLLSRLEEAASPKSAYLFTAGGVKRRCSQLPPRRRGRVLPGAHHRRVQRREQPEGVDAALCPPPLRPVAQRGVEGGDVVVRAEGEAQVGEERRRGRIHLPQEGQLDDECLLSCVCVSVSPVRPSLRLACTPPVHRLVTRSYLRHISPHLPTRTARCPGRWPDRAVSASPSTPHLPRACALEAGRELVRQGGEQRRAAARRVRPCRGGRSGEIWGDLGRSGEIWGDMRERRRLVLWHRSERASLCGLHLGESRRVSATLGDSRRVSANLGENLRTVRVVAPSRLSHRRVRE